MIALLVAGNVLRSAYCVRRLCLAIANTLKIIVDSVQIFVIGALSSVQNMNTIIVRGVQNRAKDVLKSAGR